MSRHARPRRGAASHHEASPAHLRREVAHLAARLIADDGLTDYAAAKRKAAASLGFTRKEALPDNLEIEAALREHLALFQADTQPEALRVLRTTACEVMRHLARFSPSLVGSVLSGVANEFSPIELEIITDDAKALDLALLNANIAYDTHLGKHRDEQDGVPVYCFDYDDINIEITVFLSQRARAQRVGRLRVERAGIHALEALIAGDSDGGKHQ